MFQIAKKLMFLTLGIPRIHVNTCGAIVVILTAVNPVLSVPYLQFLVA